MGNDSCTVQRVSEVHKTLFFFFQTQLKYVVFNVQAKLLVGRTKTM